MPCFLGGKKYNSDTCSTWPTWPCSRPRWAEGCWSKGWSPPPRRCWRQECRRGRGCRRAGGPGRPWLTVWWPSPRTHTRAAPENVPTAGSVSWEQAAHNDLHREKMCSTSLRRMLFSPTLTRDFSVCKWQLHFPRYLQLLYAAVQVSGVGVGGGGRLVFSASVTLSTSQSPFRANRRVKKVEHVCAPWGETIEQQKK